MQDRRIQTLATRTGLFALSAAIAILSACTAQTLPGIAADPQAPPTTTRQPPAQGSGDGVVAVYHVRCRECSVVFTTPEGMEAVPEVKNSFRRAVQFAPGSRIGSVTLTATPTKGGRIFSADIRVGSNVRAESGLGGLDEPVTLNAIFR